MSEQPRLVAAFAEIDADNADDPNFEQVDGVPTAAALLYGQRMTEELASFEPTPPAALAIACRAQHIRRWEIPRSNYPKGLVGYKKWRATLARYHATLATHIATRVGFDNEVVSRVGELIRKQRLATDCDARTLEDVAASVFVRHYLAAFASEHPREKVIDILRKTMAKMSERGRSRVAGIELGPELGALLAAASAPSSGD